MSHRSRKTEDHEYILDLGNCHLHCEKAEMLHFPVREPMYAAAAAPGSYAASPHAYAAIKNGSPNASNFLHHPTALYNDTPLYPPLYDNNTPLIIPRDAAQPFFSASQKGERLLLANVPYNAHSLASSSRLGGYSASQSYGSVKPPDFVSVRDAASLDHAAVARSSLSSARSTAHPSTLRSSMHTVPAATVSGSSSDEKIYDSQWAGDRWASLQRSGSASSTARSSLSSARSHPSTLRSSLHTVPAAASRASTYAGEQPTEDDLDAYLRIQDASLGRATARSSLSRATVQPSTSHGSTHTVPPAVSSRSQGSASSTGSRAHSIATSSLGSQASPMKNMYGSRWAGDQWAALPRSASSTGNRVSSLGHSQSPTYPRIFSSNEARASSLSAPRSINSYTPVRTPFSPAMSTEPAMEMRLLSASTNGGRY